MLYLHVDNFQPKGYFKCRFDNVFLAVQQVCNGIINCRFGSDELFCETHYDCPKNCICTSKMSVECKKFDDIQFKQNSNIFENLTSIVKNLSLMNFNEKYGSWEKIKFLSINSLIIKKSQLKRFSLSSKFPNLILLKLEENLYINLQNILKTPLSKLQKLSFFKSNLNITQSFTLNSYKQLRVIDFSSTNINVFHQNFFKNLNYLQKIIIENCIIRIINKEAFYHIQNLEYLYLKGSNIPMADGLSLIKSLKNVKEIQSEYFTFCCFAWKYSKTIQVCQPDSSTFNSCSDLLESRFLRTILWIFFLLSFVENFFAIVFQVFYSLKKINFFHLSLNISDFGMSIYLFIIGLVDILFRGQYIESDYWWRNSIFCSILGVFCSWIVLSSISSLLLITLERFQAIVLPFNHKFKTFRFEMCCLSFMLILSLTISLMPLLLYNVKFSLINF